MAPLISFGGLASGLDTQAIIDALVGARRRPIDLLEDRKAEFDFLKSAYESLRDKLTALEDAASELAKSTKLLAFEASSSDPTVVTATADGSAAEGSFSVQVTSLAKAKVDASGGYADFDTTSVGSGTIKITVGGTTTDVVIDPSASTLEDVRDAINQADAGVTATIVNEGTGASPYKLVVSADQTGTANAQTIDLSAFSGSLAFTTVQAAADASLTVNGISVTRSENEIDDVVPGVTFQALSLGSATVTLSPDYSAIEEKIEDYVAAHNDLVDYVNSQIEVDPDTQTGGPFNGESAVRSIKSQILSKISLAGFPGGSLSSLAEVGLELEADGTLTFDSTKFEQAAKTNLADVTALLTTKGDYVTGDGLTLYEVPDDLAAGSYAVQITQAATKAAVTAGSSFASPLPGPETLTITQGSLSVDVQLAAGDTLADAVSKINQALADAGIDVTASDQGGSLSFEADVYGQKGNFTVVSDVASGGSGVGTSTLSATGLDVQGTIGGEAAVGDGQFLEGASGGTFEGVKIRYTGTTAGSGTLVVGPDGFFVAMEDLLDGFLDPVDGAVEGRIDGIEETIDDIEDRIDALEDRLDRYRETLERQFTALEQTLGRLQSQQSFLATLPNLLGLKQ